MKKLAGIIPFVFFIICFQANAAYVHVTSDTGTSQPGSNLHLEWDLNGESYPGCSDCTALVVEPEGLKVKKGQYFARIPVGMYKTGKNPVSVSDVTRWVAYGPIGSTDIKIMGCAGAAACVPLKYCIGTIKGETYIEGPFHPSSVCSETIPPTPTASCKINGGSDINVGFGQLERTDIGMGIGGEHVVQKIFTISCDDSNTHNFSVRMNMSPASWNIQAIQADKTNVGVITQWNGTVMANGATQNMAVNGSASATLKFTPVRPDSVSSDQISTGTFSASATLIVTQL